ncbi:MAG: glycosyltransferase family 1 protein [bacterium]|nr:glycosyltransferase family 1 protein [bacterium]
MAKKIYIESRALVADHFSGVGHYIQGIANALDDYIGSPQHAQLQLEHNAGYRTILWAPRNHVPRLAKFSFLNLRAKAFAIPSYFIDRLLINNLIPPLDLWFGRGTYLFTNFSRFPLFRAKSATIVYDASFESVPQFVDANNRQFLSKMVRKAVNKSDLIITISKHAKEELVNFYNIPAKKVIIAYPAVDRTIFYKRSRTEIATTKNQYGLPGNYLLFVGNIEPRKNISGLIEAYTKLPVELCQRYPLLLIGANGWLTEDIFSKIDSAEEKGYPIVRPNKYVADSDLPAIYSGATLLVYPSHYEGFGIPPLEAMACGVPVICGDNSSLPEAVGDAGLMVNSSDTAAISNAIEKLLQDEHSREELIEKGYQQVRKFSWQTSANVIYKALIGL